MHNGEMKNSKPLLHSDVGNCSLELPPRNRLHERKDESKSPLLAIRNDWEVHYFKRNKYFIL